MRSLFALIILSVTLLTADNVALARGHGRYHSYPHYRSSGSPSYHYGRRYGHSHGRTHRSLEAKHAFWDMTGHPRGWPGHVVDHIVPLACGGADSPSNMQWQTRADARAKDKIERRTCGRHH